MRKLAGLHAAHVIQRSCPRRWQYVMPARIEAYPAHRKRWPNTVDRHPIPSCTCRHGRRALDPWAFLLQPVPTSGSAACSRACLSAFRQAQAQRRRSSALSGLLSRQKQPADRRSPSDFDQRYDREERALTGARGRSHSARRSSAQCAVVAILECACWFNPLMPIAARLMRIDQELSCDAHGRGKP